jgi:hypothetical protein
MLLFYYFLTIFDEDAFAESIGRGAEVTALEVVDGGSLVLAFCIRQGNTLNAGAF